MKAKEWYTKLKNANNKDDFETVLTNCLESLCNDADHLIKIRRAHSDHAIAACIDEVNNKWSAIIRLINDEKDTYNEDHPLHNSILHKDGFKAAYVHLHPKRGWYFDMETHKKNIENMEFYMSAKNLYNPVLILYGLTPYDKLENDLNILRKEFLHVAYTLGSMYKESGNPFLTEKVKSVYMRILTIHMSLLRFWIQLGSIDIEDVDIAYTDHEKLIEKYQKRGIYF